MSKAILENITELPVVRVAPHNLQAEQMLLGAILINNNLLIRVSEYLLPEHFYEPVHQRIYKAILNIIDKGLSASPISLRNVFENEENLVEMGGGNNYLLKLATLATTVIDVADYGQIIYDLAMRRSLIEVGEKIVNTAYNPTIGLSASNQLEKAEAHLFNLALAGTTDKSFMPLSKSLGESITRINKAMKNSDSVTGISTALVDLDKMLSGFHNSDLVIMAGRPSMGKTAVALNLALNCCRSLVRKHKDSQTPPSVGFFSLEMSAEQLATRMLSMVTSINSSSLKTGKVNEELYNELQRQAEEIASLPFFIDDTPALSIAAIRTRARRLKRKHNLGLLFIDYLQLVRGATQTDNRVQEVSEVTQGLKALAKELDIPIVALSQLSRAVEQREDKRPMLSDLRESGAIEQDADIVMFLYRDEYYLLRKQPALGTDKYDEWLQDCEKVRNKLEIIIAKHRNGPVGTVGLYYDTNHSKISNLDTQHEFSN
jgi:replicative DNA helicase